ncbi:anti-anti-sigma factor [Actinoplanes sp. SE50]|uniref:STAS domain-containing protein n=1 Tax=unclassified Actinoplanes TaxID=2626549 RepID=UPI00023EC051|nr:MULTISPECIES: STAS domain-containing protein [unclassified Actinoplanes]AEV82408.1 Anti-sigma F factor antagonist [Actinoplanes sp. SE50/110]ATO80805.1 anti-anti-sigma factor [Actinoplanes sp. SE50]SLL98213.1 anti-anti-sigma factor [Actinoplanes sp. SE50/110]
MTLSITTSTLADGAVEVSPRGEIDVENAYEIREAVAAQLADGSPARIELNMQHVTFIDSVGISALVAAFQLAGVGGVKVVVTHPSRFAHRQLWVTGLLGLFGNPAPHEDDAALSGA